MGSTAPALQGAGAVAPLPRARTPHGTQPNPVPPPSPVRVTTAPPSRAPSIPPLPAARREHAPSTPVVGAAAVVAAPAAVVVAAPVGAPPALPAARPSVQRRDQASVPQLLEERGVGTARVARGKRSLVRMLALPIAGTIVVGVCIGGVIAYQRQQATPRAGGAEVMPTAAPSGASAPAPILAAPIAAPAEPMSSDAASAPAAAPALVDVRIDSTPAGATVTIIDRGKRMFLGTTPISTALDPARAYEVELALGDHPVQRARLEPGVSPRLTVALAPSGDARVARSTPSTPGAPRLAGPSPAAPRPAVGRPAPAEAAGIAAIATIAVPEVGEVGEGVLMISSKPPCEIHVDGKPTGLMTPQRALPLPAGAHKITLVNEQAKIKKTIRVTITADEATKVIQDLM